MKWNGHSIHACHVYGHHWTLVQHFLHTQYMANEYIQTTDIILKSSSNYIRSANNREKYSQEEGKVMAKKPQTKTNKKKKTKKPSYSHFEWMTERSLVKEDKKKKGIKWTHKESWKHDLQRNQNTNTQRKLKAKRNRSSSKDKAKRLVNHLSPCMVFHCLWSAENAIQSTIHLAAEVVVHIQVKRLKTHPSTT